MAIRSRKAGGGVRQVNTAARGFVESVARVAAEKVKEDLPSSEQFRELKRTVRELQKKLQSRSGTGTRKVGRPRSNRTCGIKGCNRSHVARGFCSKHYQAQRRDEQAVSVRKAAKKKSRRR